jgi:hypothetical protein
MLKRYFKTESLFSDFALANSFESVNDTPYQRAFRRKDGIMIVLEGEPHNGAAFDLRIEIPGEARKFDFSVRILMETIEEMLSIEKKFPNIENQLEFLNLRMVYIRDNIEAIAPVYDRKNAF